MSRGHRNKQIFYDKHRQEMRASGVPKKCDHPHCVHHGEYPAPKSAHSSGEFFWFCLEHVKEYNQSWDYYKGMRSSDIEFHIRFDATWQRPTWPFGHGPQSDIHLREKIINDDFLRKSSTAPPPNKQHIYLSSLEKQAFEFLKLDPDLPFDSIKQKYRLLVKKFHPDSHQGDENKEEILKKINAAFAIIKAYFHDKKKTSQQGEPFYERD